MQVIHISSAYGLVLSKLSDCKMVYFNDRDSVHNVRDCHCAPRIPCKYVVSINEYGLVCL